MKFKDLELDAFQADAISALEAGKSVLVCAPTGTGKTIIADWLVDRALTRKRQVIYTAPIKALSNQKFRDWTRAHGDDAVGLLTGDLVIRREAACRVMTTEILRNMLLSDDPMQFADLDAVIIDEIHFLDDRERGTVWEELLIYLPKTVQILGLSATLSNANQFAAWMSEVRQTEMEVIRQDKRTVPLDFWVYSRDSGMLRPKAFDSEHQRWEKKQGPPKREERGGRDRHGGGGRGRSSGPTTSHADAVHAVWESNGLPCLYFVFSRKLTEQNGRALTRRLEGVSLLDDAQLAQVRGILERVERENPQLIDQDLRDALLAGVAWHHAGCHVQIKALVEDLYERRLVRVLYCTSTFALGINMPARTVIFDGLRKFDGISMRPLTTREFLQKAGRAGRRGMDTEGHVVIRVDHSEWNELSISLQKLLQGQPEPVRSSFSLSFNSVVNLLSRNPLERVREIVDRSFLAFARQAEARRLEEDAERLRVEMDAPGDNKRGSAKQQQKDILKLERRAEDVENRSWMEFEARIRFLVSIGYLAEDLTFNAGAKVLTHIQMEEIFMTELILSGALEELTGPTLFGLLCAVNKEFGRNVRVRARLQGQALTAAKDANKVRMSKTVVEAERITGFPVTWCPEMIPFGAMWAEGRSFNDCLLFIDSETDMSGDLVGAFRRAKDLIGQIKDVYKEDDAKREMLTALLRAVSRDEVLVID
ncbi:MAG: DEAD/DEAH box helicase [Myxococcales bacterium]|nr:DEAD/DEAH box helicase [Myxococcales bacterium]